MKLFVSLLFFIRVIMNVNEDGAQWRMEGHQGCYTWVRGIMKLVHGGVDGLMLYGVEIMRMKVNEW